MTTSPDLEAKAIDLFEAALEQPSQDRREWLITCTHENPELQRLVLNLLSADEDERKPLLTGAALNDHYEDETPFQTIGAYKITELIGQGGMGSVYKGERDIGDFDHVVAIKVIKRGLLSKTLKPRFKTEQQILAQFSHPNIARLFDGGETPDGHPFIIMEYIEGAPITEWVQTHDLSEMERLTLFKTICNAVSYAHQNLIIHRDLTPSNILVTQEGLVKLIDFGIAKPHTDESEDVDPTSSMASLSFTPGFAAPERVTGRAANTLSDVYSLGKILAVLLDEKNPAPDISSMIAKATMINPLERYSSVDALRDDIDNYLQGLPVNAVGGGSAYRLRKFIKRNRMAVAASALIVCGIFTGLVVTSYLYRDAEQARAIANQRYEDVHAIANTLMFDVYDEVSKIPGSTKARALLASTAQEYLDSLAADETASPDIRLSAGLGYQRLARTMGSQEQSLGNFSSARENYEKSRTLLQALHSETPKREDVRAAYAKTLTTQAGDLLFVDGNIKLARSRAQEARDLLSDVDALTPSVANTIGTTYYYEGGSLAWDRDFEAAQAIYTEGIDRLNALPESIRETMDVRRALGILWTSVGETHGSAQNMPDAILALKRSADIRRSLIAESENTPSDIRNLTITLLNLVRAQGLSNNLSEALVNAEEAHDLAKRSVDQDADDLGAQELLSAVKIQYGGVLAGLGRTSEADVLFDEAISIGRRVREKNSDTDRAQMAFAVRLAEVGLGYQRLGDQQKSCASFAEAIALFDDFQRASALPEVDRVNIYEPIKAAYEACPQ